MNHSDAQAIFRGPSATDNNGMDAAQEECHCLSPTLVDILSDDCILRFYQCVKDIKTQQSPRQTAAMFFALCHALGDSVAFFKLHQMPKILFRQEQQVFAVNVAGDPHDSGQQFNREHLDDTPRTTVSATTHDSEASSGVSASSTATGLSSVLSSPSHVACPILHRHAHPNRVCSAATPAGATAAEDPCQQPSQAAFASAVSPASANGVTPSGVKRKGATKLTEKRAKKASPRDKEFSLRRNDIIQDLLKVSDVDLMHQANIVEEEVKMIIQGQERNTAFGAKSPLDRLAALANLSAHYDSDFAPKNAGVYFNYEYFQLFLAYRDLEEERQQQQHSVTSNDSRPLSAKCRTDIEKALVNTNWEAIRRRLTIGERIFQMCDLVGRGFLLLSKQVSGRKLLHHFNTGEWAEFMGGFQRPENQMLLGSLQAKYAPERFYGSTPTVREPAVPMKDQTAALVPEAATSPDTAKANASSPSVVTAVASTHCDPKPKQKRKARP